MKIILLIIGLLIIIGSFITLIGGQAPIIPGFLFPVIIGGILIYFGTKKGGNDIREIKNKDLENTSTSSNQKATPFYPEVISKSKAIFLVNDHVTEIKTGRRMKIREIKINNVHSENDIYICYSSDGAVYMGDFKRSEINLST